MPAHAPNGPTWEAVLSYLEAGEVIVGIDEVGRGALAGPVVAAAVILPPHLQINGLRDSKLTTLRQRERLNVIIRREALAVAVGWVSCLEIDERGLSWAVRESGLRALASLEQPFTQVILDGSHNYLADTHPSTAIVKADALVTPVAAASVIAKFARDRYMARFAATYPQYGFERHVGYGSAAHLAALRQYGPSPLHRHSYRPVAEAAK